MLRQLLLLSILVFIPVTAAIPQVECGEKFACVVLGNGSVQCWGDATYGQLGYGNAQTIGDGSSEMPSPFVSLGVGVSQISAGKEHTCVVTSTGGVKCWGRGDSGRLGYGNIFTIGDQTGEMPPDDVNVGGAVKEVAAGGEFTCALLTNDTVRCWGRSQYGQLGQGNTISVGDGSGEMPPSEVPLGGAASMLVAGEAHACVRVSSNVRCWGYGAFGNLGNGQNVSIGDDVGEMPPADVPLGGPAKFLSAGTNHNCAIYGSNGAVKCWGSGAEGRLGSGSNSSIGDVSGAIPDVNLGGSAKSVHCGESHTCAILTNGSVRCWGRGVEGQLGYENGINIGDNPGEMPPPDVKLTGNVSQLSLGSRFTCALFSDGSVRCWGLGASGQLGSGSTANIGTTPGDMPPQPVQLTSITKPLVTSTTTTTAGSTTSSQCEPGHYGQDCTCTSKAPSSTAICRNNVWVVNETISNNGTIVIGTSTIVIKGNYTQDANSTLHIQIHGDEYGTIVLQGCATLNGTLVLELYDPPLPGNTTYPIIQADCIEGSFNKTETSLHYTPDDCEGVEVTQEIHDTSLSVIVSPTQEDCGGSKSLPIAMIVGVTCAVIVITLLVVFVLAKYFSSKHNRWRKTQFRGSRDKWDSKSSDQPGGSTLI